MASDFESRVRQTGLNLCEMIEGETPSIFEKEYWMGKAVQWCMKNHDFKVAMFRFIDVLPCLRDRESVAAHLMEYFCDPEQNLPKALQLGLGCSPQTPAAAKMVAGSVVKNVEAMGKQFIAGTTPLEALSVLSGLRDQGMAFSADLLGEAVVSEAEAEQYLARYIDLFDILNGAQKDWAPLGGANGDLDWGHSPKINVSIKPSALYSQMNPRAFDHSVGRAKERLRPIIRKAVEVGAHVCLDMEHHDLKDLTLALYKSLMEEPEFSDYPHTGTVIQSYLRDSERDLQDLVSWGRNKKQRFTIRLVKGAYWDAEIVWAKQRNWPIPFFTNKLETDAQFEKLAQYLMKNHQWVNLACASHNIRSIACVMELARGLKVPEDRLEYQVLFGMAEPVRNALRAAGIPLRLYAPIGEMIPGMAYLVRRLLENTSNESFLRQSFVEGVSREELLKSPLERLKEAAQRSPTVAAVYQGKGPFQNEPLWDWTLAVHRKNFSSALEIVRKKFPFKVPVFIGGKEVKTGGEMLSTNPNDPAEVVGVASTGGSKEADAAVAVAREAFVLWKDAAPEDRAAYLFEAASAARKMRYELAALQVHEVGKNWSDADADVCEAIDLLEYYGREMIRLREPRRMGKAPGEMSRLFYGPRGVTAVIAPWNFPLAISAGMTSAALVTGNTVIYKPSPNSSVTGLMLYELFQKARFPAGVLNLLTGGAEVGKCLVTHPDVAIVAFTGSTAVGLQIIESAAKTARGVSHVKHVVAEMGGKNAIIVDEDADLDEAIVHILNSAFGYQGQKCSACSRLIVLEKNYDKLIGRLKAAAQSVELGPAEDPKTFMGAVINDAARKKIESYIDLGKKEANLLLERGFSLADGHVVPLTIFTDVESGSRIAQEEIFGPVLAVIKVKSFDEALDTANATPYALTGGLFSRSPGNIERAEKEFRVGNLYVNRGCTGAVVGRHPFGGFKLSGLGSKAGGPDYLLQFMVPRNVVENTLRRGFAPPE